jgi:hypothetical protein
MTQTPIFRMVARVMRAFAALLALGAGPATAQSPPAAGTPAATANAPTMPDAAGAVEAFFAARAWLDAGGAGAGPATPPDVHSAAAVLRARGRIAGRGLDAGAVDRVGTLARAMRAALDDATSRAEGARVDPRTLTLELELAGPRVPLIGRTFQEVGAAVEPGECGLQMTDGTRTASQPASHLLARRMAAPTSRAILAMVTELGLPARDLPDLQALGGATAVYGAWGVRLAQPAPDAAPLVLARLTPPAAMEPLSRPAAAALASRIVARLERELAPPPDAESLPEGAAETFRRTGLRGTYLVPADLNEPVVAPAADQAFVAWALAQVAGTRGFDEPLRARAAAAARRVLSALAEVDPSESPAVDDVNATSFAVLAIDALREAPGRAGADEVPASFVAALDAALGRLAAPASIASLRAPERAHVLAALAARIAADARVAERAPIQSAIDALWTDTRPAQLVAIAPWLMTADRSLGRDTPPAAARDAMDAARTVVLGTQVRPDPGRPPSLADEVGAFPVTGSSAGRISSQSCRVQALIAMLAGIDARAARGERDAERAALGWGNRFIAQLCVDAPRACFAPRPDLADGGILASTVDASMPPAAQGLALWALAASERALERLEALESAPTPPARVPGP